MSIERGTWKYISQNEYVSLKDIVTSTETNFIDVYDNSKISITNILGESGKKIYEYKLENNRENSEIINQGNLTFIKSIQTIDTEGKGFKIVNPIKRITIDILSTNGIIQIIFDYKSVKSLKNFNDFIKKIKKNNL